MFAVVVTKIDGGVSDELAEDMKLKKQYLGDYSATKDSLDKLREELDDLRKQIKSRNLSPAEENALRSRKDMLEAVILAKESQILEIIVTARSSYIKKRLKKEKKKYLRAGTDLPVSPISNQQYAMHKHAIRHEGPRISVKLTGVPLPRSYALKLAAPAVRFPLCGRHTRSVCW